MLPDKNKPTFSWFWKWFLDNKAVSILSVTLLAFLNILVFTKISYVFQPIWQFFAIVGFPIVFAGILFYFLNPLVNWLEKKGVPRVAAIFIIFVAIIALIALGVIVIVPKIKSQTLSFINNWPNYWEIIKEKTNEVISWPIFAQYADQLEKASENLFDSITNVVQNISKGAFQGIGSIVGKVANVVVTLVTMPFILFYLLKDGKDIPAYLIQFLPTKARKPTLNVLLDINKQVSMYIRGQLTVALTVAIMFMIGFSVVGLDYSVTLGILAGFLNLIPYLGSALATIPAILLALVHGPSMMVKVVLVFIIEQLIEGKFVSPLVLGSQLEIHPVTIIFVLLTSGKLFGIIGVVLGIPGYAALKVLVTHLFNWYKQVSGLYEEDKQL